MLTLLERDTELAHLGERSADAESGRGHVVFVSGEAGIGKSALVADFAESTSLRTAFGRCDPLATPRALGPFLDVAAALDVAAVDDRDVLLGRLLDELRSGPATLVVVEDAHWADGASIELLAMLGRRVADLPVLLVVTYRTEEVAADHALRLVVGDLVTSRATTWLGLQSLSVAAVGRLAGGSDVAAGELHRLTCGNPFFLTEVLAAGSETVPQTVRIAVLTRLARLPPDARAVVDAVSIVPGQAEDWLLARLGGPAPGAVDVCVDAGVLVAGPDAYRFRHELARLATEGALDDRRRQDLHRRAVAALSTRPGVDPARLAHHAAAAGDDEVLAGAANEACLLAVERAAFAEAVSQGEQAMSVAHLLQPDQRAVLAESLGSALSALDRSDEAVALFEEAAAHWRARGARGREAAVLLLMASALGNTALVQQSVAVVQQAVELLEREPPGADLARAYTARASAYMLARQRDQAAEWGAKAIALARELDDRRTLARALIQTGIADVMDARFDGLARIEEGIGIGRAEGFPAVVALGLLQIGSGCGEMRRYSDAVPALVEGAEYCEQHHLESYRRYIVAWLARCRFDLGLWAEAEAAAREAASRSVGISRFVAVNTLGWLRTRRGDDDAWPLLDEALEIARRSGHLQRLWPVAVARAEAGSLAGGLELHVPLLEEVLDLAIDRRHGVAAGEIGLWLARAGRITTSPPVAVDPFARWINGDHLGAAADLRRMGCPYEAASALVDAGDTPSLREAYATFSRLGAAPMVDSVASRLRSRGARVALPRAVDGDPVGLSPREHEVLKLVAAGFTNPQIAASLYISRKTAEHHVSSILVKLGVGSRAEAAAAAVRLGMTTG